MAKISIDATWLGQSKTGTAIYLLEILNCWNLNKELRNSFVIFRPTCSMVHFNEIGLDERFSYIDSPEDRRIRIFWQQLAMVKLLRDMSIDVHWGAGFVLPLLAKCPMVVTIHDLTFHKYPETHERIKRIYFPYMIQKAVRKAVAILTISENTRRDLCELFPLASCKTHVTTLAARSLSDDSSSPRESPLPSGLSKNSYFLSIGTIEPRKNLSRLLQAWSSLGSERRGCLKLVVVGLTGWMVDEIFDELSDGDKDGVIYLDYVPDTELKTLLKDAMALVYPSLYEGFGLPVVEAMSLGVPVITSDIGATREIGYGAAELVDPLSVQAIQDAIVRIATMPELRCQLSRSGKSRAASFSWSRAASATLSVLECAAMKTSDLSEPELNVANAEYFNYLRKRSFFGQFYRDFFLYPRVVGFLKGTTLDVGCGIGDMLEHRPNTIGVDINPYNVEFCKKRGLFASIMQEDSLPYEKETFDSVLLDNVLEHVADPTSLVAEIKRVLKPSGVLVIGVPGVKGQTADSDHKIYYNEVTLDALAVKSGFKVNRYMYAPLFRSNFLSRTLSQYCIYTQWQKSE